MSRVYIEYHYSYTYHGRPYTDYKQYPVGTSWGKVKEEQSYGATDFTGSHLRWPSYAWPGGYEIHYITADGGVLCHECANKELERTLDAGDCQFHIIGQEIHWEGQPLTCDHCNRDIESCYGDPEEQEA